MGVGGVPLGRPLGPVPGLPPAARLAHPPLDDGRAWSPSRVAISLSGGARSPAWACLFYVVVFAAYFFKPPAAAAYFLACVVADVVALVERHRRCRAPRRRPPWSSPRPRSSCSASPIVVGKRFLFRVRRQAERLAAEQGALRRVATAVVSAEPADRFYQIVAVEAGQLLAAGAAAILRLDAPDQATILGSWAQSPDRLYRVGDTFPVAPDSDLARALDAARPVRVERVAARVEPRAAGLRLEPRRAHPGRRPDLGLPRGGVGRLRASSGPSTSAASPSSPRLISTAITNIEDRAALAAQASTDALTGVANHRAFYERLTADWRVPGATAARLSVAMIDVDRFKLRQRRRRPRGRRRDPRPRRPAA